MSPRRQPRAVTCGRPFLVRNETVLSPLEQASLEETTMKRYLVLPLLAVGMVSAPAMAAPLMGSAMTADHSMVQNVQGFHKDCAWVDNKWTYRRGDKFVVCRPHRPS